MGKHAYVRADAFTHNRVRSSGCCFHALLPGNGCVTGCALPPMTWMGRDERDCEALPGSMVLSPAAASGELVRDALGELRMRLQGQSAVSDWLRRQAVRPSWRGSPYSGNGIPRRRRKSEKSFLGERADAWYCSVPIPALSLPAGSFAGRTSPNASGGKAWVRAWISSSVAVHSARAKVACARAL